MYAIEAGDENGFPVLLLHGLGASGESWVLQSEALVQCGYRVLAPDLPGFGKTPADARRWRLSGVAAELQGYLDEKKVTACGVMGISMGGVIAQILAANCPERIRKVILINTFASLRRGRWSERLYFIKRGLRAFILSPQAQADLVARRVFPNADQEAFRRMLKASIAQADGKVYRACMLALARYDGREQARKIAAPVLVISGANDTTVPLEVQKELVHALPHAAQVIIPHAGHAANIDQPQLFNRLMLEFYANPSEIIRRYASGAVTGCLQ